MISIADWLPIILDGECSGVSDSADNVRNHLHRNTKKFRQQLERPMERYTEAFMLITETY